MSDKRDFGGSYTHKRRVETAKSSSNASLSPSSSGHDVQSDQKAEQLIRKGKAALFSQDKKSSHVKGKKSLKRPTPDSSSNQKSFLPEGSSNLANVSDRPPLSLSACNGVGDMAQKQGHCHPRRGVSPDQSCFDGHNGVVRRGLDRSMEAHFFDNSNKYKNREVTVGPSDMGSNIEPMVEVSQKCTTNLRGRSTGVEQA